MTCPLPGFFGKHLFSKFPGQAQLPSQPVSMTEMLASGFEQDPITTSDGRIIGYRMKKPLHLVEPVKLFSTFQIMFSEDSRRSVLFVNNDWKVSPRSLGCFLSSTIVLRKFRCVGVGVGVGWNRMIFICDSGFIYHGHAGIWPIKSVMLSILASLIGQYQRRVKFYAWFFIGSGPRCLLLLH